MRLTSKPLTLLISPGKDRAATGKISVSPFYNQRDEWNFFDRRDSHNTEKEGWRTHDLHGLLRIIPHNTPVWTTVVA